MDLGIGPYVSAIDVKKAFVQKLKQLDENDLDFENKLESLQTDYLNRQTTSIQNKRNGVQSEHDVFSNTFLENFFSPRTSSLKEYDYPIHSFRRLNNAIDDMMQHSRSMFDKQPTLYNTHGDGSYYKYNSSFTTFNDKGEREEKTLSRVEKVRGNQRYVSQVSRTQQGNKIIEERINQDGTVTKTEKLLNSLQ